MKTKITRSDVDSAIATACEHAREKDNVDLSEEAKTTIGAEVLHQKLFGCNLSKSTSFKGEDGEVIRCMIAVDNKTFLGSSKAKHLAKYRACSKFYKHYIKTLS